MSWVGPRQKDGGNACYGDKRPYHLYSKVEAVRAYEETEHDGVTETS